MPGRIDWSTKRGKASRGDGSDEDPFSGRPGDVSIKDVDFVNVGEALGYRDDYESSGYLETFIVNNTPSAITITLIDDPLDDGNDTIIFSISDASFGFSTDMLKVSERWAGENTFGRRSYAVPIVASSAIKNLTLVIEDNDSFNELLSFSAAAIERNGNGNRNVIYGSSAANIIRGLGGIDDLYGLSGNDQIWGGTGRDYLHGGTGSDRLYGEAEDDTLDGLEGDDILEGGDGNDELNGFAGNDTLTGGNGNDFLDGGAGSDSMTGGAGNDTYIVDSSSDRVIEVAGQGTDKVFSSISTTLSSNVENLRLWGRSAINGTGNSLNNTLTGNDAANTLNGGSGRDVMEGGWGNDHYVVDNTGDVVIENSFGDSDGIDRVSASVNYSLTANVEHLTLTGSSAINGTGNALNNSVTGNSANNTLSGGDGSDTLIGGLGNDTLVGGAGNDVLNGYGTTANSASQFDVLQGDAGVESFILGGSWGVSYVETGDGYAIIQNWNWQEDRIHARGTASQYQLEFKNVLGSATWDTEIYYVNGTTRDRIAVVQDTTNVFISADFVFV